MLEAAKIAVSWLASSAVKRLRLLRETAFSHDLQPEGGFVRFLEHDADPAANSASDRDRHAADSSRQLQLPTVTTGVLCLPLRRWTAASA